MESRKSRGGDGDHVNSWRQSKPREEQKEPDNSFRIHRNYTGDFHFMQRPRIIGYWSIDGERKLHFDMSQLRYYVAQNSDSNLKLDLNEGLSRAVRRPNILDHEGIDHLLKWIQTNRHKLLSRNPDSCRWLDANFLCYRGTLCKILQSPYDAKPWTMCAMKWRGSIYMTHYATEKEKKSAEIPNFHNDAPAFWGEKFRQYMLSDDPKKAPDTSKPLNESEKFYCVFSTCLNKHKLLYRAEVDGVQADSKFSEPLPLEELKMIKLRTGKLTETPKQQRAREGKTLKIWAQTYLTGTEDIVRGLREDCDGIVRRIVKTTTIDLERDYEEFWSSKVCLKFADEFLNFVDRTVKNDCDTTVYQFDRVGGHVTVTELPPTSKYAFLPDWYTSLPEH